MSEAPVHPSAASWRLPPPGRPALRGVRRTNLRELAARPARFEHHLTVVARAGCAQLEIATASEPLSFAHVNVSDEYALALPTGDAIVDGFPLRTFVSDPASLADVGRYNHRVGDLVLHPDGFLHWPGRLRAPYELLPFPDGVRRCMLSLVFCGSVPAPPGPRDRPLAVTAGREADAKSYATPPAALALRDLLQEGPGTVARVGDATLSLLVRPGVLRPARGAYVVVLDAEGGDHHACDLLHVAPGAEVDASGIARAVVLACDDRDVEPPPPSWDAPPPPAFAAFDESRRAPLPLSAGGITVTASDAGHVLVAAGGSPAPVPRFWLARMLFRVALHRPLLGYVETYGGFFFDDRSPERFRLGVRGAGEIALPPAEAMRAVEAIYRAVAPAEYSERPGG